MVGHDLNAAFGRAHAAVLKCERPNTGRTTAAGDAFVAEADDPAEPSFHEVDAAETAIGQELLTSNCVM